MTHSRRETKIVILLILAFTLGLLIGLWLLSQRGPEPPPEGTTQMDWRKPIQKPRKVG